MTLIDTVLPSDAVYLRKYPRRGTRGHFLPAVFILAPLRLGCAPLFSPVPLP